jgi:hypothetical protein
MSYVSATLPCKSVVSAQEKNTLLPKEILAIQRAASIVGRASTFLQPTYVTVLGKTSLLPRPVQAHVFPDCATLQAFRNGRAIAANYQNNPPSLQLPVLRQIQDLSGVYQ